MKKIDKIIDKATKGLNIFACCIFAIVVLATLINSLGRTIFNAPLKGSMEIVQYGTMLAAAAAMARTGYERKHIIVTILQDHMPKRLKGFCKCLGNALGTIVFGGISVVFYNSILDNLAKVRTTESLRLPYYLFYIILLIGFVLGTLVYLFQFAISVKGDDQ